LKPVPPKSHRETRDSGASAGTDYGTVAGRPKASGYHPKIESSCAGEVGGRGGSL